mgnify:CR=1 FL=1
MHKVWIAGAMLAVSLGTAQAQALDLHGIGVSRDVPCKGQDVIVTGNGNQFRHFGEPAGGNGRASRRFKLLRGV